MTISPKELKKPIDMSQYFIETVTMDSISNTSSGLDVYNTIKKDIEGFTAPNDNEDNPTDTAIKDRFKDAAIATPTPCFSLTREDLIDELLTFFQEKNTYEISDKNLREFILGIFGNSKKMNTPTSITDCVDSLLLPLIFEDWQKDKRVYRIGTDVQDEFIGDQFISFDLDKMKDFAFPVWVEFPQSAIPVTDSANTMTSALVYAKCTDYYITFMAWYFSDQNEDEHAVSIGYTRLKAPGKKEMDTEHYITAKLSPCTGADSTLAAILPVILSESKNLAEYESANTYHAPTPGFIKNKISEVQVWTLL